MKLGAIVTTKEIRFKDGLIQYPSKTGEIVKIDQDQEILHIRSIDSKTSKTIISICRFDQVLTEPIIKAIKLDCSNSVLLEINKPNEETFQIWFDLSHVHDLELNQDTEISLITGDWNQYIFHRFDSNDMRNKRFQEDPRNYEQCLEIATDYFKNFPF